MFRPDRTPRGEDPLLLVKMTIFVVAAAIAFVGMALQRRWVIVMAIVLLALGFLLRFLRPASAPEADDAQEPPPEEPRPGDERPK